MDITRYFIEAAVNKALRDVQRDPERSIRNTVDLAKGLSKGRFQSHFLQTAQNMLQYEQSAYYVLARHAVADINHDALRTFGVNLGYNSFTIGARRIRQLEEELHANIPWILSLEYRPGSGNMELDELDSIVAQGKALGIYCYAMFCRSDKAETLAELFHKHIDCAFVLFMLPAATNGAWLRELSKCYNLMMCVCMQDPQQQEMTDALAVERCLYSVYSFYDHANVEEVASTAWLEEAAQTGAIFAFVVSRKYNGAVPEQRMRSHVNQIRAGQEHPIFLMDFFSDIVYIDEVISDQACSMGIRANGDIFTLNPFCALEANIRRQGLREIICEHMRKAEQTESRL